MRMFKVAVTVSGVRTEVYAIARTTVEAMKMVAGHYGIPVACIGRAA